MGRAGRAGPVHPDLGGPGALPDRGVQPDQGTGQRPGGGAERMDPERELRRVRGTDDGVRGWAVSGLAPSRAGVVGSALLFVSGLGLVIAGAGFPLREDAAGVTYDPGGHSAEGFAFFTSSALALLVISFALAKQDEWRKLAMPVRVAGILMLVSNPFMGILVIPDDAPLHDWAGLAQRLIVLGLLFPARLALSQRLLRLAPGFARLNGYKSAR